MEAKKVHSGSNITTYHAQGEVVCDPLSKVNFKGQWEVRLKPGTRIKRGATFRAYIADCGVVCPIPSAYVIEDTVLCGPSSPFHIGGATQPNTTYSWSSDQPGALAFIDDPSVSDPLFNSPVEIGARGTIKYTLTAVNNCGASQVREVIISYDNNPVDSPYFEINNILSYDSIFFNLDSIHPQTEKIKVQILSCNGQDTLEEYEFLRDIDFACCNFNFNYTDWLYPCDCYKVRVATKNYCFDTWVDTVFNHIRNDSFDFAAITNVGVCKQDHICFKTKGTVSIDFDFFNRWGQKLKDFQSSIQANEVCFTVPDVPSGTYFITGEAKDCYGNTQSFSISFAVFCSEDYRVQEEVPTYGENPDSNSVIAINKIFIPQIDKNSLPEKISYIIFPNPTTKGFYINYNTLQETNVSFKLYNALGKVIFDETDFITKKNISIKKYFDVSTLASGVYYLKFAIGNENFIERIVIANN